MMKINQLRRQRKGINSMNMFDEITETKKNLPKLNAIEKEVGKYSFNGYQKFAIVTYVLCFAFGIILLTFDFILTISSLFFLFTGKFGNTVVSNNVII